MDNNRFKPHRSWCSKFARAFRGVAVGVRGQSSFAVHFTCTALVLGAAVVLRVTLVEWCLLLLCITLVLSAEMFNGALESLARAIDEEYNAHLADGLDVASSAVLLAAGGASTVGVIIFLNRAIELLAVRVY